MVWGGELEWALLVLQWTESVANESQEGGELGIEGELIKVV